MSASQSYSILGEPVSGKNHMQIRRNHRTGGRFIAIGDAAASWQVEAVSQLVRQRGRRPTIRGPVYVDYTAYQRTDRRDVDNIESALFDALAKARVIEDDLLIVDHRGRKAVDAARPRIEVSVTAIPTATPLPGPPV